jgi:hypothetical protein
MDKEKIKGVHFVSTLLNYLNKSETKNQRAMIICSDNIELNRFTHELFEKDILHD